jgi:SNF2 family DNA or RNA helicase
MQTTLRSYQEKILDELKHIPSPYLLMGTGTGKTIVSLARFERDAGDKVLVICPKKIINQWQNHFEKEIPYLKIKKFKSKVSAEKINDDILEEQGNYDVLVLNYEIMHKLNNLLSIIDERWTIILDEGHRIRNYGTKRNRVKSTSAILRLSDLTNKKMILTATPTQANYGGYIDYYPQLKFLGYIDMDYETYYNRYCITKEINYGNSPYPIKTIIGYRKTDELDSLINKIARRYTATVGDFEPQHNKVSFEQTPSYKKIINEQAYKNIMITNNMRKRVALKTIASGTIYGQDMFDTFTPYEDNTSKLEWLEDFISDTDEIVTIFYQYNVELEALKKLMAKLNKRFITINGQTKDAVSEVKRNDYDVIIGQFQAMSESIDGIQHKSHIIVFLTMPESSLTYKQAIGRIDRIGQTKVPMYYYLIMDNTLDDKIYKLIEQKIEFSERLLDQLVIEEV